MVFESVFQHIDFPVSCNATPLAKTLEEMQFGMSRCKKMQQLTQIDTTVQIFTDDLC
jgi:hypothetical protein